MAGGSPSPSPHTRHPSLTQHLQRDAPTAVAQGISGLALAGATVACWVRTPDTQAQLGTLRVQHEPRSAWLHLPLLGSQPEELGRWRAPEEGTSQPGVSPPPALTPRAQPLPAVGLPQGQRG